MESRAANLYQKVAGGGVVDHEAEMEATSEATSEVLRNPNRQNLMTCITLQWNDLQTFLSTSSTSLLRITPGTSRGPPLSDVWIYFWTRIR